MASPSIPQGIIYLHTNLLNGKVYVGQTWGTLKQRWRNGTQYKPCRLFQRAIQKYGHAAFDHQVIGAADTQERLDNLEKVWIILLQATNPNFGYNLKSGGSKGRASAATCHKISVAKRNPSAVTRLHLSLAAKLRRATKKTRRKLQAALIGNKRALGHKHSIKTRHQMSESHTGVPLSKETCRKVSAALQGHKVSAETRRKQSKATKAYYKRKSMEKVA